MEPSQRRAFTNTQPVAAVSIGKEQCCTYTPRRNVMGLEAWLDVKGDSVKDVEKQTVSVR